MQEEYEAQMKIKEEEELLKTYKQLTKKQKDDKQKKGKGKPKRKFGI
jgi:hypothetical protein